MSEERWGMALHGFEALYPYWSASLIVSFYYQQANKYFVVAASRLYDCTQRRIRELAGQFDSQPTVYITGHSLGGAIATIIAGRLIKDQVVDADRLKLYTFGSPRVGNPAFSQSIDNVRVYDAMKCRIALDSKSHITV